ncbi:MAG TPA: RCC1 domain-containing protein [Polyangiaceae bacterium]|nr:RCC1 domain-containing protein [Polyangiaceae bacterium]
MTVGPSLCVLLEGGQVLCENDERRFEPIALSADATALSAGSAQTCALLASGRVTCWGCRARDGTATAQVRLSLPLMKRIAVGESVACGVTTDDKVVCWGALDHSQGRGHDVCSDVELETVAGPTRGLTAIALSPEAKTAEVWALDAAGRVLRRAERPRINEGYSYDTVRRWAPLASVPAPGRVVELGVGGLFDAWWFPWEDGCTLGLNGAVRCLREPLERPIKNGKYWWSYAHACALLSDGRVTCWGDNRFGQAPPNVELPQHATALAVGGDYSCALLADQTVSCWGADYVHGAPDAHCPAYCGYNVCDPYPRPVENLTKVTLLRTASNGTRVLCAVTSDRWLVCLDRGYAQRRPRTRCESRPG